MKAIDMKGWRAGVVWAVVLLVCGLLPAWREAPAAVATASASFDLPATWDGQSVRPLSLSEVEQRFAARFPGHIARLTDGQRMIVLREVHRPTRMLHPAADCYRALGWRIVQTRLERDGQARLWRCFHARRDGMPGLRVCERIEDAAGRAFTDTSAWYWAGVGGHSTGPWQAVTVVTPL